MRPEHAPASRLAECGAGASRYLAVLACAAAPFVGACSLAFPDDGFLGGSTTSSAATASGGGGAGGTTGTAGGGGAPAETRIYIASGGVRLIGQGPSSAVTSAAVANDGSLGAWQGTSEIVETGAYWGAADADHLFLTGDADGVGNPSRTILLSAPWTSDGLGAWSAVAGPATFGVSGPILVANQAWAVRPGRAAYFIGGDGDSGSTTYDLVYVMPFKASGQSFALEAILQNHLPHPLTKTMPLVVGDSLFVIGGQAPFGTETAEVLHADLDSKGIPGPFTHDAPLVDETGAAYPLAEGTAVSDGEHVYVVGGHNPQGIFGRVVLGKLEQGKITSWKAQPALPNLLTAPIVAIARGRLYVLGGLDSSMNGLAFVYAATIGADGSLGAWMRLDDLPYARWGALAWSR